MRKPKKEFCNLCGLSCVPNDPVAYGLPHGLHDEVVVGGYASTPGNGGGALDDETSYRFSLCEWCLDFIFEHCMIPPEVRYVTAAGGPGVRGEPFSPAAARVARDDWRGMKEQFWAEQARRDAARRLKRLNRGARAESGG